MGAGELRRLGRGPGAVVYLEDEERPTFGQVPYRRPTGVGRRVILQGQLRSLAQGIWGDCAQHHLKAERSQYV